MKIEIPLKQIPFGLFKSQRILCVKTVDGSFIIRTGERFFGDPKLGSPDDQIVVPTTISKHKTKAAFQNPVWLKNAPIGVFASDGKLFLKTEYELDCYNIETGEKLQITEELPYLIVVPKVIYA